MGKLFSSTKRRERAPGSDINIVYLHTAPSLLIQDSLPCSQAIHTYGQTDCRVHLYDYHMYLLLHLRGLKHPSKMWDPIFRSFRFATFLFCIFVLILLLFASMSHFVTLVGLEFAILGSLNSQRSTCFCPFGVLGLNVLHHAWLVFPF